jgi:hypothetical protein
MFPRAFALSLFALSTTAVDALASDYPDLRGAWVQTSAAGARFGDSDHSSDEKAPAFYGSSVIFTLTILKQDGAALIGTWSSEKLTENLVGVIRRDKLNLLLSDEDNQFEATLISQDEMEVCTHAAGDYANTSCRIMKRQ